MLSLIFGIHGTEEDKFVAMVDFYEDMNVHLKCINELLDKQSDIPRDSIGEVKKIILKTFGNRAKFIKECFLSFKNF